MPMLSRYLFGSTRLQRHKTAEFRKYSRHAGPRLSGCLCNLSTRSATSFLLLRSNNQFLPSAATLSWFSRSTPAATLPTDSSAMSSLPYRPEEIGSIPEPPPVPSEESLREMRTMISDNMREIGLASYATPSGWIQNLLDVLHSTTGLPWWEVIVVSTVIVRICSFPVMVYSQRRTSLTQVHNEEMQKRMQKVTDAQSAGDAYASQMAMMEVQEFMKEKNLPSVYKTMIPTLANGAIFMSYFFALRGMANARLWSLQHEGTLWFTDLTLSDPTLLLPVVCAVTLLAMLEIGVEYGVGAMGMKPGIRWAMRFSPLVLIFFAKSMPAAVLCYWITSNSISMAISLAFRIPKVRNLLAFPVQPKTAKITWKQRFGIPQPVKDFFADPRILWYGIRDWRKNRVPKAPNAEQFRKQDMDRFKQAGTGPIPATFTFDPRTKYKDVFEKRTFWGVLKNKLFAKKKKAEPRPLLKKKATA